ncbi:hypothetical protein LCGC14_2273380 [marine sediment metagenome]|uniref:Uncharacterized protein n=1 Tax=marine sediment metagenome TaxID=412755 RepID=A0A0F9DIK2_9ZZZZ
MQVIEDEVIGELRYLTVEFDQAELLAGHIGVISQGAVRRYFEGKSPDLKVKKCGGLKLDSQRDIVTMRFGIVDRPGMVLCKNDTGKTIPAGRLIALTGADGSKIEGEKSENVGCGDRKNQAVTAIKFLNPGYDELKKKYDDQYVLYTVLCEDYSKVQEKRNNLLLDYKIQSIEVSELKEKCDALVAAVMQDAQKFSDLLVENEELKTSMDDIRLELSTSETTGMDDKPLYEWAAVVVCENIELKKKYDALVKATGLENHVAAEDVINLADMPPLNKAAIELSEDALQISEDSADLGPEGEPELVDGKPDCNGGCNSCESHACDIDETH